MRCLWEGCLAALAYCACSVVGEEVCSKIVMKLSEGEIERLLDTIYERTGDDDALVFRYRFHALFPELGIYENSKFTIKDGYVKLRQHREYYRYALSLIIYMVEGHGSKEEVDSLMKHVSSSLVFETDVRNQRLNLWIMLSNIATELDARNLVSSVGRELNINTDHMTVDGQYSLAAALKAFRLLEEKKRLEPMLADHPPNLRNVLFLEQLLKHLNKTKLINEYVTPFNPHRPVTLAVLNVESKYS